MRCANFLAWHRKLALLFAPLILLQALTGSILLFREPLGRLLEPMPMERLAQGVDRLFSVAASSGRGVERLLPPAGLGRWQQRTSRK